MSNSSLPGGRALAAQEFHRARRQAAVESIVARLSGRSADLLSYDEVSSLLKVTGQSSLGVQQIPVAAIVGSVGRFQDFSRTFLPRLEEDEQRWVSVRAAARYVGDLPPIEVYRIGDAYFVLDGNHRVSIARQENVDYIDALVIDVKTRVPLPPGAKPDDLIIAAEQAAFLEFTRLDQLRPDADLTVSEAGQYRHLEDHIEAYRYLRETELERALSDEDAVTDWYDRSYLPMVEAIREQGILRYFPGRTEADFYIWLSRHRSALQHQLGWEIAPDVAVSRLLEKAQADAGREQPRTFRQRLSRLILPDQKPPSPDAITQAQRAMARYGDHLFANILLPIPADMLEGIDPGHWPALQQATLLAVEEGAQLCGLFIHPSEQPDEGETIALAAMQQAFAARRQAMGLSGNVAVETGDVVERVSTLALLNDLVVLDRSIGCSDAVRQAPSQVLDAILRSSHRPVFVVGEAGVSGAIMRVLLVHDGHPESDEGLFIAAYLGERWGVGLHTLLIHDDRAKADLEARIHRYLEMHELSAETESVKMGADGAEEAEMIRATAERVGADLIIMRGPRRSGLRQSRGRAIAQAEAILQDWPRSLLITT